MDPIIVFPEQYNIERDGACYEIAIPSRCLDELHRILRLQQWISSVIPMRIPDKVRILLSDAYQFDESQARAALEKICKHVMGQPNQ